MVAASFLKEETHLDLSQDIEIYTSKELLQQNKDNSIKHSGYGWNSYLYKG